MAFLDPLNEALLARLPDLMRATIAKAWRVDQPFGCALADAGTSALPLYRHGPTGKAIGDRLLRAAETFDRSRPNRGVRHVW
jgi:hypothetical protein